MCGWIKHYTEYFCYVWPCPTGSDTTSLFKASPRTCAHGFARSRQSEYMTCQATMLAMLHLVLFFHWRGSYSRNFCVVHSCWWHLTLLGKFYMMN